MKIYGLDFTSAPSQRKPITCAASTLIGQVLRVQEISALLDFAAFETFLRQPGPWVAGLDFPFGQPRALVEEADWPRTWTGYVARIGRMSRVEFEQTLTHYRGSHVSGQKQPRRKTDVLADSRSPMMLYGVPVGKMFFEGAPRLWAAGVCVFPCHLTQDKRVVIEAYPALVMRWCIGRQGYKNDSRAKQSNEQRTARRAMVNRLSSPEFQKLYGFSLALDKTLAKALVTDPTGDTLDAVLCAVQAAWAHTQREGLPKDTVGKLGSL